MPAKPRNLPTTSSQRASGLGTIAWKVPVSISPAIVPTEAKIVITPARKLIV